jgi:hypothetical protein
MPNPMQTGRPSLSRSFGWLTGEDSPGSEAAQQELLDLASRLSFTLRLSDWQDARPDHSAIANLAADIAATLSQQGASGIGIDTAAVWSQMSAPEADAPWNAPEVPDGSTEAAMTQALLQATGQKHQTDSLWFG